MYYQTNPYFRNTYPTRQNNHMMKVYGEGSVLARPDQATVLLGVVTEDKDLQTAQQTNAAQTTNVINAMVESGVPRENIQTSDFRIDIQYDYQNGVQKFRGYQVTNLLTVKISDIDTVGQFVDIAVENGANTVRNIELTVSNRSIYYNQALTNAIQNAQDKAATMAEALELSINLVPTRLKEITSMAPEPPRPLVLGVSTEMAKTTPIEAGQLEIKALVEADFTY